MLKISLYLIFMFGVIYAHSKSIRTKTRSKRIVGEDSSDISQHSYQVAINKKNGRKYELVCGGSILNGLHILCAGNCMYQQNKHTLQVRAGSSHWGENGITSLVIDYFIHENYNPFFRDENIAILKLNTDLAPYFYKYNITPVHFARFDPLERVPLNGEVAGWGSTAANLNHVSLIRKVNIKILNQQKCKVLHPRAGINEFCAGEIEGGKGGCFNNRGSPMIILSRTQIGILRYDIGRAEPNCTGLYVNNFRYNSWIEKIINLQ